MENSTAVPQKVKNELPYDPGFTFLDICSRELKAESRRDICTFMFIAAYSQWLKCRNHSSSHQQMNE